MKAQLASMEAIMVLLLVVASLAFARNVLGSLSRDASPARGTLSSAMAIYDFLDMVERNYTAAACLHAYGSGNTTCMDAYIAEYKAVYGLDAFGVAYGKISMAASGAPIRCFPFPAATENELCIEAG